MGHQPFCSGASLQNKQMFNIICEQPETVAQALVPGLRTVKGTGKAVNYLTPPRIVLAILNAWFRRGRWFDKEVRVYSFTLWAFRNAWISMLVIMLLIFLDYI